MPAAATAHGGSEAGSGPVGEGVAWDFSADFGPFGDRIWMNTAAQGPFPRVAVAAAHRAVADKVDPRRISADLFLTSAEELRATLARFLNASVDDVILGNSASYGLHIVANGLAWDEGDEVLVVLGDYPACAYPWLPLQKRGVKVTAIRPKGRWIEPEELRTFLTPAVKVFCTNWVNSFRGHALDIEGLAEVCHETDTLFVLNGAQAVGALPLDVAGTGVDVIASCGYKWMLGPYGTGFGWIASRLHELLVDDPCYWYAMASDEEGATETAARHSFRADLAYAPRTDLPRSARFDVFNTPNFFNFIPWRASLDYMLDLGLATVHAHTMSLIQELVDGIPRARFDFISPTEGPNVSTLVVIAHRDRDETRRVHAALGEAGIDVTYRYGLIRIAPHLHNTSADVERLVATLERVG